MNFTSESRFYNKNIHLYKYFPIKLQHKIVNGYTIKKNSIIPLYTNYFYLNLLNVQSQYLFKKKI